MLSWLACMCARIVHTVALNPNYCMLCIHAIVNQFCIVRNMMLTVQYLLDVSVLLVRIIYPME